MTLIAASRAEGGLVFITIVCDIFRKKGITMIATKAIIITTISINFIVNSTKFGSKTKLNQNLEQIT